MCERLAASRELRRCANALTTACVVSTALAQTFDTVVAEPVPARLLELVRNLGTGDAARG